MSRKIPVVRIGNTGATGTPDEFDSYFDRKRKTISRPSVESRPKLQPIENKSLQERMSELGIEEI